MAAFGVVTSGALSFDTETHLIEPGMLAPPLVCVQWCLEGAPSPEMRHRVDAYANIRRWLESDRVLVGHNVAYDMGVIAAQWPDLLPLIFAKYARDEVTDTQLREQLIMIARGTFRSAQTSSGELVGVKYTLADCYQRHFGERLKKEGFRLFYRAFDAEPDTDRWPAVAAAFQELLRSAKYPPWVREAVEKGLLDSEDIAGCLAADPSEAVTYALEDGRTTMALYLSQERTFGHLLADQFRQARAAFALHLTSAWGLYTDPDAVETLAERLTAEFEALKFELQQAGIIRADGTADTKAAAAAMVAACEEDGVPIARTKGGKVSLSAEACDRFDETSVIGQYSAFLTLRKTLTNDIKMLRAAAGETPCQPRYDMADTGRTRASKPNIQAINRGAGIREAFRPREGTVFIQADFSSLELHTRAVWCLEKIGWSKLADDLNAGLDVHLVVAADLLDITYEEAARRLAAKDKEVKNARQSAKALNFGLPGGLGIKKFIRYAKTTYKVDLTEEQAKSYKVKWMQRQPEMVEFFALAAQATANPSSLGDEECLFVGRKGTNMRYSALCNRRFQALGADAAKEALWRVTRACYVEPESPLYGCRPVAFIHDEIIAECPDDHRASSAAKELGRLMCEGANKYLHRVPVHAPPAIMRMWSKNAEAVYAEDGVTLLPWAPAEVAA